MAAQQGYAAGEPIDLNVKSGLYFIAVSSERGEWLGIRKLQLNR